MKPPPRGAALPGRLSRSLPSKRCTGAKSTVEGVLRPRTASVLRKRVRVVVGVPGGGRGPAYLGKVQASTCTRKQQLGLTSLTQLLRVAAQ